MSWRRRSLIVVATAVATVAVCGWVAWTTGFVERHELFGVGHSYRGTFVHQSHLPVALGFLLICAFCAGTYALWYRWRERRAIRRLKQSDAPPA